MSQRCSHHTSLQDGGRECLPDPGKVCCPHGGLRQITPRGDLAGGPSAGTSESGERGPAEEEGPPACRARPPGLLSCCSQISCSQPSGAHAPGGSLCMPASVCPCSQRGLHEQVLRHFKPSCCLHLLWPHRWSMKLFLKEAGGWPFWEPLWSHLGIYLTPFRSAFGTEIGKRPRM